MRDYEKTAFSNTPGQYPFRVPEGYFDNLTARIMANIPEEKSEPARAERKSLFTIKRMGAVAVAASLAIVAAVSTKLVSTPAAVVDADSDASSMLAAFAEANNVSSDEMELYSMVDNCDIYDYLAGYDEY